MHLAKRWRKLEKARGVRNNLRYFYYHNGMDLYECLAMPCGAGNLVTFVAMVLVLLQYRSVSDGGSDEHGPNGIRVHFGSARITSVHRTSN